MSPTPFYLAKRPPHTQGERVLSRAQEQRLDKALEERDASLEWHTTIHEVPGPHGLPGGAETTRYPVVVCGARRLRYYAKPVPCPHQLSRECWALHPLPDPDTFNKRVGELVGEGLSAQEAQVMALYEQGYTESDVADHLHLKVGTVSSCVSRAHAKLGIGAEGECPETCLKR